MLTVGRGLLMGKDEKVWEFFQQVQEWEKEDEESE
jgi:hypothetical protein